MAVKHAFVTGATGFLGVNLVELLHQDNWQITAIHRTPITHPLLKNKPINWVQASLDNKTELENALPSEPFIVFHLAANTSQWRPHRARQYQTNVVGTRNLIEAVSGKPVVKFIHTSSVSAFGLHNEVLTEKTPSNALEIDHHYSSTKFQAEELVRQAVESGLPAVILNPCHIVGPWDTHNWINLFDAVKSDKLPGIPPSGGVFAWVKDVADAHLAAVERGIIGENYLLGGPNISILAFVNEMQRQMGKPISKRASPKILLKVIEPMQRFASWFNGKEPQLTPDSVKMLTHLLRVDDSKAQQELGYAHKTPQELVQHTLSWMQLRDESKRTA